MVTPATGDNKKPRETVLQCAITHKLNQLSQQCKIFPDPQLPDKEQDAYFFFYHLTDFKNVIPALMYFLSGAWTGDICLGLKTVDIL